MKIKMVCFLSVLSLFLLMAGCGGKTEPETEPEIDFVGSEDTVGFFVDIPVFKDLESMVEAAEFIVVGQMTGKPEVIPGDKMTTTLYDFAVEESLKGDAGDVVKFFQLGADGSDDFETKIKRNKRYVLFLCENYRRETGTGETEIIYNSISLEQGVFEINGAEKLKSLARIGYSPKLNDERLDDLRAEIQRQTA